MKKIELDLDKDDVLSSLPSKVKAQNITIGEDYFQLQIHVAHSLGQDLYASFLLLLAKYLTQERNSADGGNVREPAASYGADVHANFYFKYSDAQKLQKRIEDDFKVTIEVHKRNTLDEVFGIWKGEDITLEKIRQKAWRRTK
ncbi:MAG TPA: hypothetical protein VNW04_20585 [Puia sp.]|jgi:hypothetical protein|nr:hypothetical protein [Puia sp.]